VKSVDLTLIFFKAGDFPVAEKVAAECLSLPMSAYLSVGEQERIVQAIGDR